MASLNCLDYKETVTVTLPNIRRLVQGQTTWSHIVCAQFQNSINVSHFPWTTHTYQWQLCLTWKSTWLQWCHETGDLILLHWQQVEDAENSNMSGTVDFTQAFDPINLAGMWEALQKVCFLKTFTNSASHSTKPVLIMPLPDISFSIQHLARSSAALWS